MGEALHLFLEQVLELRSMEYLKKALKFYPEYPNAWTQIGRIREALGDLEGALESYERAISPDPDYLRRYLGRCDLALGENEGRNLAELSTHLLERDSAIVRDQYCRPLALFSPGNFEEAEKWALSVRRNSDTFLFPTTHFFLGAIWARRGHIQSAAEQFRRYLDFRRRTSMAGQARRQLQRWERKGLLAGSSGGRVLNR